MIRKLSWLLVPVLFAAFIVLAAHMINQTTTRQASTGFVPTLVVLGDSVAAGDGLPLPPKADAVTTACGRSDQAFPNNIVMNSGTKLIQLACSGAKTTTGVLQPQIIGTTTVTAQLEAAKPSLGASDVILNIGANDVDWTTLLSRCVRTDCTDPANLVDFQAKLAELKPNLNTILSTIQVAQPRKIVVNTYYSLLSPADTCFNSYGITGDKIRWVSDRETELNDALVAVARQHKAVPVQLDFKEHELCDRVSWIQGLFDKAPLHPNAIGQQQIAAQDIQALR